MGPNHDPSRVEIERREKGRVFRIEHIDIGIGTICDGVIGTVCYLSSRCIHIARIPIRIVTVT